MTRRVHVIGIGTGSAQHLTLEAVQAIRATTVFLAADKGGDTAEILDLRREVVRTAREQSASGAGPDSSAPSPSDASPLEDSPLHTPSGYRFVTVPDPTRGPDAERTDQNYRRGVRNWHRARVEAYAEIIGGLAEDEVVGFLVWGDPAFYDSTLRIVDALRESFDLDVRVYPGIGAVQALAAAHQIVLNPIGGSIHVTTGRRLLEEYTPALGTVVVMLDGSLHCAELVRDWPDLHLYWGAYLGSPHQVLVSGRLDEAIDPLRERRAQLRAEHGWLMDTYALTPVPLG
ncbi:MAG: precorrin-6A synthase (deacetylating) [Actinomycetales bacterium]